MEWDPQRHDESTKLGLTMSKAINDYGRLAFHVFYQLLHVKISVFMCSYSYLLLGYRQVKFIFNKKNIYEKYCDRIRCGECQVKEERRQKKMLLL
jgi:hypothetical protein